MPGGHRGHADRPGDTGSGCERTSVRNLRRIKDTTRRVLRDSHIMKRWGMWRLITLVLAACSVCVPAWAGTGDRTPQVGARLGSCASRNGCEFRRIWAADPVTEAPTSWFSDVPVTVAGVYGPTTLDLLSGGPFVLVEWPDGCCSDNGKWRTGDTGQDRTRGGQHVIFLWPAL